MASKFENRIDYIDISAYGIGKVTVEAAKKNIATEADRDLNLDG